MTPVRDFKDLRVWQRSIDLVSSAAKVAEEMKGRGAADLRNQLLRAATSVPSNIAEGHSRPQRGEFLHFLGIARASLKELESHLYLAEALRFARPDAVRSALQIAEEVSRMLTVMRQRLQ